ncbi:hypothetical protein HOLleu_03820 [Holothuria leucospilota]|uniref:DED domain-containing protein n=1 Tax=Holothuria leucospilota TaxID=206669 RepID=A0A9Q1CU13_HOLLE|nr:hypothetical protein HOLleu_03820 [Holothuria leucospilota]
MTEAASTQPCRQKVTIPGSFDFGFGKVKVDVSSYLSNESVKKLATLFNFPPAKFDRVKDDSLEFVRLLEEEGIITPTDISALTNALTSIGQQGIARKVQRSFERNQRRDSSEPGVVTSELQDKHSMLVKALKEVYRRRYSGVKPVPFLHDTWRCVNDIFVESKIQVLDNSKPKEDPTRWSFIKSHHEIFTKPTFERHITIEGEPGYDFSLHEGRIFCYRNLLTTKTSWQVCIKGTVQLHGTTIYLSWDGTIGC